MPFIVEDIFVITGRGVVVTGKSDGLITTGDNYQLQDGTELKVRGIERFVNMLGKPPQEGEPIGVLLGDIDVLVAKGTVLYRHYGMSKLENPELVIRYLREAGDALSQAHHSAGESEGERTDLNGPVRDAIYGINTTVDAVIGMIEDRADG